MNLWNLRIPVRKSWVFLLLQIPLGLLVLGWLVAQSSAPLHAQSCPAFPNPSARFGYNVARDGGHTIDDYAVAALNGHWYLDYFTQVVPSRPAGMRYAQMIRPAFWQRATMTATVESTLANNPGTLWIVGNEPDRDKQDGLTPDEYATFYHDVYHFLKARDPASQVAIAGVVQSTPLRRRYLDMVLAAYQRDYGERLPVDVWTVHAFILPENYEWGASIPPGLDEFAAEGMQYAIENHDDLDIFQANLLAFRQWMAANGYRDTPLIVTEYGILLPDLAFPYPAVRTFMLGTFDYFLSATDESVGYPADANRLIQGWSWFSLNYPPFDPNTLFGHNGNLVEPNSGLILELGRDYSAYVAAQQVNDQLRLSVDDWQVTPSVILLGAGDEAGGTIPAPRAPLLTATTTPTITVRGTLHNNGTADGCRLTLKLWHRSADGKATLVAREQMAQLAAGASQPFAIAWQPAELSGGLHEVLLEVGADNAALGLAAATADREQKILVLTEEAAYFGFLPLIQSTSAVAATR
ncbi:MAG: hypothetical protein KDE53_08480 [Caldilineaceae bacterium]|nr:hypothetical protein [Caldilineaceae bacterium]